MLLAVDKIICVEHHSDGQVYVDTFTDVNGELFGVPTVESYNEVKEKIALAR